MNRRQLIALFACSLVPWWVGSGLMPLLPLYAAGLGATPALVGSYLSLIFLALASGTVFGGWLAGQSARYRELLMAAAALGIPATWLMGRVDHVWQLILLNASIWFVIGITLALVGIIAGRSAARDQRGRVFGLLAMTSSLGGVFGGPTGIVVDRWGFDMLLTLEACIWLLQIGAAFFLINPVQGHAAPESEGGDTAPAGEEPPRLAAAFWLLFFAALLFATGGFINTLGRSLAMEAQGFSSAAITGIAALAAGIALVLNPIFGRLSDRMSRRWLLTLIYAGGGLALVVTAYADSLLGFVLMAIFTAVSGTERAVSSALVSDFLSPRALSKGLSLFDAIKWVGGVVGLSAAGYLILYLGLRYAMLAGAFLPLGAIVLLILLGQSSESGQPAIPLYRRLSRTWGRLASAQGRMA